MYGTSGPHLFKLDLILLFKKKILLFFTIIIIVIIINRCSYCIIKFINLMRYVFLNARELLLLKPTSNKLEYYKQFIKLNNFHIFQSNQFKFFIFFIYRKLVILMSSIVFTEHMYVPLKSFSFLPLHRHQIITLNTDSTIFYFRELFLNPKL